MRLVSAAAVLLALFAACTATPLYAQRTAASTWNSPYSTPDASQQAIDLAIAESMQRAKSGGYGPATSTTNIGTYNSTTTYNGPATSSSNGSTNIVNSNSTSTTTNTSGGTNTISVTTGQTSGMSSQSATSLTNQGNGNPTATDVHQ